MATKKFWLQKPLEKLSPQQWESLCDGCGKCCLNKLDVDSLPPSLERKWGKKSGNKLYWTNVACPWLDKKTLQCGTYPTRQKEVQSCLTLTPKNLSKVKNLLPPTCSYLLVYEGRDLPDWHHLQCGERSQIHAQGKSVLGRIVSEAELKRESDWYQHIRKWPEKEN